MFAYKKLSSAAIAAAFIVGLSFSAQAHASGSHIADEHARSHEFAAGNFSHHNAVTEHRSHFDHNLRLES